MREGMTLGHHLIEFTTQDLNSLEMALLLALKNGQGYYGWADRQCPDKYRADADKLCERLRDILQCVSEVDRANAKMSRVNRLPKDSTHA